MGTVGAPLNIWYSIFLIIYWKKILILIIKDRFDNYDMIKSCENTQIVFCFNQYKPNDIQ